MTEFLARFRWLAPLAFTLLLTLAPLSLTAAGLTWDSLEKSYDAKGGEEEATFTFVVTNPTDHPIEIRSTSTSCHCTVAIPPRKPWTLQPGAKEELRVTVDLKSRRGGLTKTVYVDTTDGEELLLVHVQIPVSPTLRREMNTVLARGDRQSVLRGDCATCHVAPTVGKMGVELFQTACLICHGAEHRASMVPDLQVAKTSRNAAYWEKWIREGTNETLMPAFDRSRGGSLDDEQITSLVEYLAATMPSEPVAK